jgi:hypothetical protein
MTSLLKPRAGNWHPTGRRAIQQSQTALREFAQVVNEA